MRNFWINFLGIVLYRFLLDLLYSSALYPVYNSEGYENYLTKSSLSLSWAVFLLFLPFAIKLIKKSSFSANVLLLLFLIQFVPMTTMMAYMPMVDEFLTLYLIFWFLLLLLYLAIPMFSTKYLRIRQGMTPALWIITIIFMVSIVFVSGAYFGFRLTFDLVNVYDLREEVTKSGIPNIFNYLLPAAANILPVLLVYFIDKKNIKMIVILSFVILLNFSIGGHKAIFFNLILAFLGYFFFKKTLTTKYAWFLSLLVLFSILEYKYIDSYYLLGYVARRLMFVPSLLNYHFYDFFSVNEYDYYRQSFVRYIGIESPYSDPIPHIIGYHMGVPGQAANNGLFSDAYANLGVLGVFVLPVVLVFIFKLFDMYSRKIDNKYLFLPIVGCTTTFLSTFFPTALLTHGMLLLMIVLFLFPRYSK